ncbi:hypothetical protein ACSFA3_20925 [Variovorax sp. RHLX14]|uniref:hypothetical protein n=1 Tax=Variovorax sp. RHLX14 TaxID=1259731 RepID=UPI003F472D54
MFSIRWDAVTRAFERAVTRARNGYLHESKKKFQKPDARYLNDVPFHTYDTKSLLAWLRFSIFINSPKSQST